MNITHLKNHEKYAVTMPQHRQPHDSSWKSLLLWFQGCVTTGESMHGSVLVMQAQRKHPDEGGADVDDPVRTRWMVMPVEVAEHLGVHLCLLSLQRKTSCFPVVLVMII